MLSSELDLALGREFNGDVMEMVTVVVGRNRRD
jgi:hypothetical protein